MQNTVRWRSDRLDGTVDECFFGDLWSNESGGNVEDSEAAQYECCCSSQYCIMNNWLYST